MNAPLSHNVTPSSLFQAQYGKLPGTQEPQKECSMWECLCAELLAEHQRLQKELAEAQTENKANRKAIGQLLWKDCKFEKSMGEVYAEIDRETSLVQIIAELEAEAAK